MLIWSLLACSSAPVAIHLEALTLAEVSGVERAPVSDWTYVRKGELSASAIASCKKGDLSGLDLGYAVVEVRPTDIWFDGTRVAEAGAPSIVNDGTVVTALKDRVKEAIASNAAARDAGCLVGRPDEVLLAVDASVAAARVRSVMYSLGQAGVGAYALMVRDDAAAPQRAAAPGPLSAPTATVVVSKDALSVVAVSGGETKVYPRGDLRGAADGVAASLGATRSVLLLVDGTAGDALVVHGALRRAGLWPVWAGPTGESGVTAGPAPAGAQASTASAQDIGPTDTVAVLTMDPRQLPELPVLEQPQSKLLEMLAAPETDAAVLPGTP